LYKKNINIKTQITLDCG